MTQHSFTVPTIFQRFVLIGTKKIPATSALFHFYAFKTILPSTIIATGELVAPEVILLTPLLKFAVTTIVRETFMADSIWRIIAVWVGAGNIHLLVFIRPIY